MLFLLFILHVLVLYNDAQNTISRRERAASEYRPAGRAVSSTNTLKNSLKKDTTSSSTLSVSCKKIENQIKNKNGEKIAVLLFTFFSLLVIIYILQTNFQFILLKFHWLVKLYHVGN